MNQEVVLPDEPEDQVVYLMNQEVVLPDEPGGSITR